jgi:ligand-binding sensor domain-containing protein
LKSLEINATDINEGLEYLPNSVENIYCSTVDRKESKVQELIKKLDNKFLIDEEQGLYNFKEWRDAKETNQEYINIINNK